MCGGRGGGGRLGGDRGRGVASKKKRGEGRDKGILVEKKIKRDRERGRGGEKGEREVGVRGGSERERGWRER